MQENCQYIIKYLLIFIHLKLTTPKIEIEADNNQISSDLTAMYVLKWISEGIDRKKLIYHLDNNEQLFLDSIEYLKHIHWLEEDSNGNLVASQDGMLWVNRYDKMSRFHHKKN